MNWPGTQSVILLGSMFPLLGDPVSFYKRVLWGIGCSGIPAVFAAMGNKNTSSILCCGQVCKVPGRSYHLSRQIWGGAASPGFSLGKGAFRKDGGNAGELTIPESTREGLVDQDDCRESLFVATRRYFSTPNQAVSEAV